jgi:hypothetical protein
MASLSLTECVHSAWRLGLGPAGGLLGAQTLLVLATSHWVSKLSTSAARRPAMASLVKRRLIRWRPHH